MWKIKKEHGKQTVKQKKRGINNGEKGALEKQESMYRKKGKNHFQGGEGVWIPCLTIDSYEQTKGSAYSSFYHYVSPLSPFSFSPLHFNFSKWCNQRLIFLHLPIYFNLFCRFHWPYEIHELRQQRGWLGQRPPVAAGWPADAGHADAAPNSSAGSQCHRRGSAAAGPALPVGYRHLPGGPPRVPFELSPLTDQPANDGSGSYGWGPWLWDQWFLDHCSAPTCEFILV